MPTPWAGSQYGGIHIPRVGQDQRGQGFELRTDKHGAIRAQDGLLLTTEGRSNASGHITSMGETTARLDQAAHTHEQLAELAKQHQAQEAGQQDEVAKAIEAQNKAIKGEGQTDTQAGKFPEYTEPQHYGGSSALCGLAGRWPEPGQ